MVLGGVAKNFFSYLDSIFRFSKNLPIKLSFKTIGGGVGQSGYWSNPQNRQFRPWPPALHPDISPCKREHRRSLKVVLFPMCLQPWVTVKARNKITIFTIFSINRLPIEKIQDTIRLWWQKVRRTISNSHTHSETCEIANRKYFWKFSWRLDRLHSSRSRSRIVRLFNVDLNTLTRMLSTRNRKMHLFDVFIAFKNIFEFMRNQIFENGGHPNVKGTLESIGVTECENFESICFYFSQI